jgi:hypothetical protein
MGFFDEALEHRVGRPMRQARRPRYLCQKKAASVSEGRVSDSIARRPWPVILVDHIVKENDCILGAAGAISRRTPTGKPVQKRHPFSAGKYQH